MALLRCSVGTSLKVVLLEQLLAVHRSDVQPASAPTALSAAMYPVTYQMLLLLRMYAVVAVRTAQQYVQLAAMSLASA